MECVFCWIELVSVLLHITSSRRPVVVRERQKTLGKDTRHIVLISIQNSQNSRSHANVPVHRCRGLLRVVLLPPRHRASTNRHRIVLLSEFLYKLRLHFSSPRHFANDFIVPRVANRLFAVGTQWNLLFSFTCIQYCRGGGGFANFFAFLHMRYAVAEFWIKDGS